MSGFLVPLSARWAAELLVQCGGGGGAGGAGGGGGDPEPWSAAKTEEALADEMERLDLVSGIAERVRALRGAANTDPAEMEVCLQLLQHLSEPCRTAVTPHGASCLQ